MWEINVRVHVVYENVNVALVYFAITDVSHASSAFPSTIFNSRRLSQMWRNTLSLRADEFSRTRKLKTLTLETYNFMRKYD